MKRGPKVLLNGLVWIGLLLPLVAYGTATLQRPARTSITNQPIFEGILYSRRIKTQPRPLTIHILEIDLTTPGLSPFVTPSLDNANLSIDASPGRETLAQRTSTFLQTHQLQLAVNANFFFPFRETTPWDYEPKQGTPIMLGGLAISDGQVVSPPQLGQAALCFLPQRAKIASSGDCPEGTEQAVAGNNRLLNEGKPTRGFGVALRKSKTDQPYPVNIAALDASGSRLWLILSDGKQPLYSEGMMLTEVIDLVQSLGAHAAMRLDGGGSTTIAIATDTGPRILNAVIHGKIPGQERPVANHLGFWAN
ncbi:MAG: phosphodiester glycosidase family protein [Cyanobacteria bacterium P01_A01_bin.17]